MMDRVMPRVVLERECKPGRCVDVQRVPENVKRWAERAECEAKIISGNWRLLVCFPSYPMTSRAANNAPHLSRKMTGSMYNPSSSVG